MEKEKGHPQAAQNTHGDHDDNCAHTQRLHLRAAFEYERKHRIARYVLRKAAP
ncbi:MAG: hypothetical protein ACYC1G_04965 [Thiobacillus sp.]